MQNLAPFSQNMEQALSSAYASDTISKSEAIKQALDRLFSAKDHLLTS